MTESWLPAEHGSEAGGLQPRVARGLAWTIVDLWGSQAMNLAVFVVLARLLTPVDFGLVALAAIFVAFAQLVVDQGLGDALIQRRELTRSHIDTAFWAAMATGAILTLIGLLVAVPISSALGEPDLAPILQVMSLTFVMAAMSSIQVAILRRELAFRSLALRALLASMVGGLVSIPMALLDFGAWALVGQQVAAAAISVIALWRVSPWRPSLHASRAHFRELFRFGANVVASDVLNFLGRNADNLLIGVFLGTTALGFYAVGYRILEVTQRVLINIARKITFPTFSRLQRDPDRLRRAYLRVTRASGALIMPGYIGLAMVAPELTVTLFGQRWAESGPVAAILFLIGPVLTVQALSGSLLNAAGHPEVVLRFRLISSVTNIVGFIIAVRFGILFVAVAYVIRGYLLLPLILYWMSRHARIPVREYLAQLRGITGATLVMSTSVILVKLILGGTLTDATLLAAEAAAAAISFGLALWLLDPVVIRDLMLVARHATAGVGRNRAASEAVGLRSPAEIPADDD